MEAFGHEKESRSDTKHDSYTRGGKYGRLISKLKQGDAFTLIEMLLTVAIIAVLVAISIPMVSGRLERVRVATDAANERTARSAAIMEYLTEGTFGTSPCSGGKAVIADYDAAAGKWVPEGGNIDGYAKCITTHGHEGLILKGLLWQDEATGEVAVYLRWDVAGEVYDGASLGEGEDSSGDLEPPGDLEEPTLPGESEDPGPSGDPGSTLPEGLCGGCEQHDSLTRLVEVGDGSSVVYYICQNCGYFARSGASG